MYEDENERINSEMNTETSEAANINNDMTDSEYTNAESTAQTEQSAFQGAQNFNNTGAQEFNNTGAQEFNNTGAQSFNNAGTQQTGYAYYNYGNSQNMNGNAPQNGKKHRNHQKKPMSLFKKFCLTVCFAAVAGFVAGGVFLGVNIVGNKMFPQQTKSIGSVGSGNESDDSIAQIFQKAMNPDTEDNSNAVTTTAAGGDGYETVAQVAEECMPSLVTIATISVQDMQSIFGGSEEYEVQGAGTGVIVGQNDTELLIATNNHVVKNAKSLSVGFIDEQSVEAHVKGTDSGSDLAVVAVNLSDIPQETLDSIKTARIGSSDSLALGDQVVAIGNALGYGQSVTSGYVSAKGRELQLSDGSETFTSSDLIQIDAAINSGNSGGALLNMKGELVGINEAKSMYTSNYTASVEGMGYAIPIDKAFPILEELMTMPTRIQVDEASAGYLGITCADVTDDISTSYNMPIGVCITQVIEGGPCAQAGLKKGDVITAVGEYSVTTYDELRDELAYYGAGETITLTVVRANDGEYQESKVDVTLTTKEILDKLYSNKN